MQYKNVIFDLPNRILYYRISIDNKKVKILETKESANYENLDVTTKYKKLNTFILIPHINLLFRQLTIPRVSEESIYNAVKFALEEYYPGENIRNFTIGYIITKFNSKNIHLICWGIKKIQLDNILKRYSSFNTNYILPQIVLPIHQFDTVKDKVASALCFMPPNEMALLKFNEFLQNIFIKILPVSFFSYTELKNSIDTNFAKSIINFIKLNDITSIGSTPAVQNSKQIFVHPYLDIFASTLQEKGYNVDTTDSDIELLNLESITQISEQENLIKEEFRKIAPYVKVLSHCLFLLAIVFFCIVPLYLVKNRDLHKSKEISNEIKKEYESLYYSTIGEKWENFQKSLNKTSQKIYDSEYSLGIHETFPVKLSSLTVIQKIFSEPKVKDLNFIRLYIDILQKKCSIRATTLRREAIQTIINSVNAENYEAQLFGTVVTKEDNSFEFEILVKWQ